MFWQSNPQGIPAPPPRHFRRSGGNIDTCITAKSTYAKVHGSVSVDSLQRKEAEESACGTVHDPAFKITEIYFQE